MIFLNQIIKTRRIFIPQLLLSHTDSCPKNPSKRIEEPKLIAKPKRALRSGKVRMGFIPDEWFTFFHPATGVSGSYLFGLMTTHYLVSKEIYVLEHEYCIGLSIFVILYYTTTRFGADIAKFLDEEVDKHEAFYDKYRSDEISDAESCINQGKEAQMKAEGQKLLIEAKKSSVALQLEAAYRERRMLVYRNVKNRLDYLAQVHHVSTRIHHRWMVHWTLENVTKAITPELDKVFVDQAIQDLAVLADEIKNRESKPEE